MKRAIRTAILLAMLALPALGIATDKGSFLASVDFLSPPPVFPNTSYDFTVRVTNETLDSGGQQWINKFQIRVPTTNYLVPVQDLEAPTPLHPVSGGKWVAQTTDAGGIPWFIWTYKIDGEVSDGDIRPGEWLDFSFTVITDSAASDGFAWSVYADSGEFEQGIASFIPGPDDDDDDDDISDDDTGDDDGGGDDDWHGGDDDDDDDSVGPIGDDDDSGGLGTPPEEDNSSNGCGN